MTHQIPHQTRTHLAYIAFPCWRFLSNEADVLREMRAFLLTVR